MSVQVQGFAAAVAKLAAMEARLAKPFSFTKMVAETFAIQARESFQRQQDPYGVAWKPLKRQRTADVKAARIRASKGLVVRGGRILAKSGALRKSLRFTLTSASTFTLDSNLGYAQVHQYGSSKRNIPQRSFMAVESRGVPAAWLAAVARRANGNILTMLRESLA